MVDKENKLFTVVTCTYNRKKELKTLYSSLLNQKELNFQWLVIDDCSTDNTDSIVKKWKNDNNIPISYHKMGENGGKYRALNYALEKIITPLFIIIDSDDYLVEDGSLIIKNAWDHYKNMGIGSIIMEHGKNGINDPMLKIKVSGHIDYRYYYMLKRRITGDYADVFVTSCVNNFRFPVFKNEKFMSEQPLYYWFSQRYKSVFISKVLTVGNYLDDGLSRNLRKLEVENWKCTLYESNLFLSSDTPLWYRLKKGMLVDFILIKKKKSIFKYICKSSNRWILMTALLPAAMYTYFKR